MGRGLGLVEVTSSLQGQTEFVPGVIEPHTVIAKEPGELVRH